jgi:hypothetical protein
MDNGIEARWKELCTQAASERNPSELTRIVTELNLMLEQRERILIAERE